jgi:hypothetical protein
MNRVFITEVNWHPEYTFTGLQQEDLLIAKNFKY